jgi:hypothetical protein
MTQTDDARLEDLVEIYAASSAVEADRIVLLLDEDGIESIARETTMSSFPSPADSSHLILVREASRAQARALLEAARRDGAISESGAFL